MTTIGQRIREIRKSRNLTQRELADRVGINFTYLSRVENDRLDDEQTPREETLQRIAKALEADPDELLLLARRIPDSYRDRILSSPGVFRKLLNLSDADLEDLVGQLSSTPGVPDTFDRQREQSVSSVLNGSKYVCSSVTNF